MENKAFKIWRHVDFDSDNEYLSMCCKTPKWLNYKTWLKSRIHNKDVVYKWELVLVEFYLDYNTTTNVFSDLILKVEFEYTRNADGTAIQREKEITWIHEDGSMCQDTKIMVKYYTTPKEKEEEVQRRRRNIILSLKWKWYGTPFESSLNTFTDSIKDRLDLFILRGWDDLRNFIINIDWLDPLYSWMDMDLWGYTARQIFLNELDI